MLPAPPLSSHTELVSLPQLLFSFCCLAFAHANLLGTLVPLLTTACLSGEAEKSPPLKNLLYLANTGQMLSLLHALSYLCVPVPQHGP